MTVKENHISYQRHMAEAITQQGLSFEHKGQGQKIIYLLIISAGARTQTRVSTAGGGL